MFNNNNVKHFIIVIKQLLYLELINFSLDYTHKVDEIITNLKIIINKLIKKFYEIEK